MVQKQESCQDRYIDGICSRKTQILSSKLERKGEHKLAKAFYLLGVSKASDLLGVQTTKWRQVQSTQKNKKKEITEIHW